MGNKMPEYDPKTGCDNLHLSPFGGTVDLNNPTTYKNCTYRNWDVKKLRQAIYEKVGYAKLYVEFFHPDWDKTQVEHINQLLFWFSKEHRKYYQDTPEARFWLRKWLFIFNNEIENMC